MTLGNIISEFRALNDLTMDDFSKRSGISKSYISMLEKNKDYRGNAITPSIETIDKVATAIGIDVDTLVSKIDQNIVINSSNQQLTEFFESNDEENAIKWKFIRYCFEHASKEDQERVLSILRVKEKYKEFKEIESIFFE